MLNQDRIIITEFSLTPAFLHKSISNVYLCYVYTSIFGLDIALIFKC